MIVDNVSDRSYTVDRERISSEDWHRRQVREDTDTRPSGQHRFSRWRRS